MADTDRIANERQFSITVAGIAGTFTRVSGGATQADTSHEFDGGSEDPEVLAGDATTDDVTVSRPWRPERDSAELARLRPLVRKLRTTITVQPLDEDLVAVGRPTVYTALLKRATPPTGARGSNTPAALELMFAVESVR